MNAIAQICTKCKELKEATEFYEDKRTKDGLQSCCKICSNKATKKWSLENKEHIKELNRKWYLENKEYVIKCSRKWAFENRKHQSIYQKQWGVNHPELIKAYSRKSSAKERSTPKGKLNDAMSSRMYKSLKSSKAYRRWEDLVGYTIDQLKHHLEKRFKPGMTWDNYGKNWEIDHKVPIVVFNFEKPEDIDFRLCWSLKNLQPLEVEKNSIKNAKIDKPFQPSLAIAV